MTSIDVVTPQIMNDKEKPQARARELLNTMIERRESLLLLNSNSNHSTLARKRSSGHSSTCGKTKNIGAVVGTTTGKPPLNRTNSRAREILKDLRIKRATLCAVLEAVKSSRGNKLAIGTASATASGDGSRSTAPTAASTQSVDDASFIMSSSLASREDASTGNGNGVSFLFETDESTLSQSTNGDIGKAVGDIYSIVIPKALSAYQEDDEEDEMNDKKKVDQREVMKGDKSLHLDRIALSPIRENKRSKSSKSMDSRQLSVASSSRASLFKTLSEVKALRRSSSSLRRPQNDQSRGSAPPAAPSRGNLVQHQSCVPDKYVMETKFKRGRRRRRILIKSTKVHTSSSSRPRLDPDGFKPNLNQPLHRQESIMSRKDSSRFEPGTPELASENGDETWFDKMVKDKLQLPSLGNDYDDDSESESESEGLSEFEAKIAKAIEDLIMPKKVDFTPEDFNEDHSNDEGATYQPRTPPRKTPPQDPPGMELTPEEPSMNKQNVIPSSRRLAKMDSKLGRRRDSEIPEGTIITVDFDHYNPDDDSTWGWSYSEANSNFGMDMLQPDDEGEEVIVVPKKKKTSLTSSTSLLRRDCDEEDDDEDGTLRTNAEITHKFAGGLYHIAVMSGMEACELEV